MGSTLAQGQGHRKVEGSPAAPLCAGLDSAPTHCQKCPHRVEAVPTGSGEADLALGVLTPAPMAGPPQQGQGPSFAERRDFLDYGKVMGCSTIYHAALPGRLGGPPHPSTERVNPDP